MLQEEQEQISEIAASYLPDLYNPEAADHQTSSSAIGLGGLEQNTLVVSVQTVRANQLRRRASRKVSGTYKALCRTHASSGSTGGGDRRESVGGRGDRPSGEGREHGCLKVPTQNDEDKERARPSESRQFCDEGSR